MALAMICSFAAMLPANTMIITANAMSENEVVQWMNSKNGTTIKDGGTQCVAAFNSYLRLFGISNPIGMYPVNGAYQIFDYDAPSGWKKISGSGNYRVGDVVIWSNAIGNGWGHVGMVYSTDGSVKIFDQNWNVANQCGIHGIAQESAIRGVFRPPLDDPTPLALTDGEKANLGDSFTAEIVHANSGKKITNSSDNAVLYAEKTYNTAAQRWDFTRNSDGSYTISNNVNHKVLDLDNSNNSDGANIHLWGKASPKTANQKWFIHKRSDGKYYLRPACSDSRVLDLTGGKTANDTNVQLYEYNGSNAQLFNINKTQKIADLGKNFYGLILNYDAWKPILQADNNNVELGTEIAPIDKNGKIHKDANYDRTLWHFKRNDDDGSYVIYSILNNYCLKVSPDKNDNFEVDGNNVKCYNGDGSTKAQRWFIIKVSDDKYTLRPLGCSKVMDLTGNKTADGTNIEVFTSNNTAAQIFNVYKLDKSRDTLNYSISAAKTTVQQNQKTDISVGGTLTYAYSFKFHIIDPDGNETVKNNKASPVYSFSGSKVGKYIIYAEVKNPIQSADIGSKTKRCVTINVTCAHKLSATAATAATCTTNGCKAYWYCSNCKKYFSDKDGRNEITLASTVIKATGHNYGAPSYTWSSDGKTCTAKRVCKNDSSHTETEKAAVTSKVKTAATCTAKGTTTYTAVFKNSAFSTQTKDVQDIAVTAHSWSAWTTTRAATCTADGTMSRTCSGCNKTETQTITKLGHNYIATIVAPSCTQKGYTLHKCSRCNDFYKDNYTNTTSHSFSEWNITKQPTTTANGERTRRCTVCGKRETESIPMKEQRITRLAGKGRYETAVEISKAGFPNGTNTVVLAYGLNYADALAGVPLAKKLGAPILLTDTNTISPKTLAEIKRLGATNVIILGGEGVISDKVNNELKSNGLYTKRICGKTRFSTATAIAQQLTKEPTDIFLVYAYNYADALSASTAAAINGSPIVYLKTTGELDADTAEYLTSINGNVKNAYVIGGTGVISDDMLMKAGNALGVKPIRIAGQNRYETCVSVNNTFKDILTGSTVCVAKGLDFPDALAGGVFAAQQKAPLFLADNTLKDEQKEYLKAKKADTFYVFGGTGAVADKLVTEITASSK